MELLQVERIGVVGMVRPQSRVRGLIDLSTLPEVDQRQVDALFRTDPLASPYDAVAGVRYQLTRNTGYGTETVVAPEAAVPATVAACVIEEAAS
ncbi:hypothetical protein [Paludisphaera rhizosphaerae]|uniref:hypothetical protein n=1 Tax=Paludisphaera rhizosphaerae TaxID=2711216 RepID=UPI0013EB1292|nr:hypothetical protein [Paludisphaera rhizosphaerae]